MGIGMIKVLSIRVGNSPETCEIANDLRTMQEYVGGYLESFPLDSLEENNHRLGAIAILNEEGKITRGVKPNRNIYYKGKLIDVFYGDFFVCGCDDEGDFVSITQEQEVRYKAMFADSSRVA